MGESTDRNKRADIFRKAAGVVERKNPGVFNCACYAIWDIEPMDTAAGEDAANDIERWFGIDAKAIYPGSCYWGRLFGDTPEEMQDGRALMLCFMAAMVEAGDA